MVVDAVIVIPMIYILRQCLHNYYILQVCTFSLIFKNASSLLDDKNPVKLEVEAMLGDLVR